MVAIARRLVSPGHQQQWYWFCRINGSSSSMGKQFKPCLTSAWENHYSGVIMSVVVSLITSLMIVYSTIYSGADQRKHQSSAQQAFVRGIRPWPTNSPQKGPVTRKIFPFNGVIMGLYIQFNCLYCVYASWNEPGTTRVGKGNNLTNTVLLWMYW